ncbi:CPBP family intramembrane metalloprotease [Polaribacter sp. ALD11]|uniref:CPBP family intramembrane glutamic endopeptidase n=1 Tax=Polaribacter sp. ALD11 TaxID=2058137 RepID=UPI000C30C5B7|nr:CPBP family intramembrane glutamic endopeptidase [Polaribacter sp. ALD11]AUC83948.1 CPBP family intramembrane metalloprotease [Polaribacter sp. ALD11]
MKETFLNLITYLKNPVLEKDSNTSLNYRFTIFFRILIISLLTGIIISPIFALIEEMGWVNMQNHKVEAMFENMGILQMFLLGAIAVPAIEEALFRGPITAFKKPKYFKIAFYAFALLFGFIHITNFDITTNTLLLSPLLVLPQILLGGYFGYIRVRFGLQWSILLHGCYNGTLILLSFIFK